MEEKVQQITPADLESFRKIISLLPGIVTGPSVSLQTFVKEDSEYVKYNFGDKYYSSVALTHKHILKYFSPARDISTITIKDAEMFIRSLRNRAPAGFRVYLRNMAASFNRAIRFGYLKENVFEKIKAERRQQNKPAVINEAELETICSLIKNETIAAAIRFDFYTGLRASELINLKFENINLEKRILTVGDHTFTCKNRKQRFVPLCEKALYLLEGRCKRRDVKSKKQYLFAKPNSGFRYTVDCISKNFKRACRKAGIDERVHLHSVRASFATYLAEKGANAFQLKELLGHSSITVSQIYTAVNVDSLRDIINKFN